MTASAGRDLALAVALVAFLGLAARQGTGLLRALAARPAAAERRAILEEIVWVLVAAGTVLSVVLLGWRSSGG